jgi:hypothetical protein
LTFKPCFLRIAPAGNIFAYVQPICFIYVAVQNASLALQRTGENTQICKPLPLQFTSTSLKTLATVEEITSAHFSASL